MNKLDTILGYIMFPIVAIRRTGATILVFLNIWLFSGVANILEGILQLTFSETLAVTVSASIILLMIPGVEKAYAQSGGKMTDIEKRRIKIMWFTGAGLYLLATGYAVYASIDCIETNNGKFFYHSFNLFGLMEPVRIDKTLNYTSLSFTLFKVIFALPIDYIAGTLIDREIASLTNSVSSSKSLPNHILKTLEEYQELIALDTQSLITKLGGKKDALYKYKNKVKGYDVRLLDNFPDDKQTFLGARDRLAEAIDKALSTGTF